MQEQVLSKKAQQPRKLNRCNLCAMPAFRNPGRHMRRHHPGLSQDKFRCLKQDELPTGPWKYCSNWEHIWEEGFEAKDEEIMMKNQFE